MSGIRASFCKRDDARPATVEIAFISQNSGPGVSVLVCPECTASRHRPAAPEPEEEG